MIEMTTTHTESARVYRADERLPNNAHTPAMARFDLDVLIAVRHLSHDSPHDSPPIGADVSNLIEMRHPEAIEHGRLYPAIHRLEENDLIIREKLDGRSKSIKLTDTGVALLDSYEAWVSGSGSGGHE